MDAEDVSIYTFGILDVQVLSLPLTTGTGLKSETTDAGDELCQLYKTAKQKFVHLPPPSFSLKNLHAHIVL